MSVGISDTAVVLSHNNVNLCKTRLQMPRKEGSILIVDDNNDLLMALKLFLSRQFERIDTLKNPNLILSTLEKQAYDIILLDMNFKAGIATGNEGIFWLHQILEKDPDGHGGVYHSIRRCGAGCKIHERRGR